MAGKVIFSLGLVLELVSAVFSVTSYFCLHVSAPDVPKDFVLLFRYLFQLFCLMPVFSLTGRKHQALAVLRSKQKWLLLCRSFLGVFSIYVFLFALEFAALADVVTIAQCSPVLVVVLSWLLLHEVIGVEHIACVISCVIGIILVTRPTFLFPSLANPRNSLVGMASALTFCSTTALMAVIQRKLTAPPFTSLFILGILPTPILLAIVLISGSWRHVPCDQGYVLLGASMSMAISSYLSLRASSLEEASVLSLVRTCEVPLSFSVQAWIIWEPLPWTSYAGAVLVCLSLVVIFGYSGFVKFKQRRSGLKRDHNEVPA